MNMVGTPWTAVQRSSDMAVRVWSGIEVLGRYDHGGAVDDAVEGAHDAAEAVVEGHGDAEAIMLVHLHAVADMEGVGEDVVVGEGRALGVAGSAGGVLDVDGVVGAALRLAGLEIGRSSPALRFAYSRSLQRHMPVGGWQCRGRRGAG